jgi:hypothetical protein
MLDSSKTMHRKVTVVTDIPHREDTEWQKLRPVFEQYAGQKVERSALQQAMARALHDENWGNTSRMVNKLNVTGRIINC